MTSDGEDCFALLIGSLGDGPQNNNRLIKDVIQTSHGRETVSKGVENTILLYAVLHVFCAQGNVDGCRIPGRILLISVPD